MKANRAYVVKVRRGGFGPAILADADRVDQIEVVQIDSGEVVLFWDTLPGQTRKLARALKSDLAQLDAVDFVLKWEQFETS
jgi:hypothetical protein